jgi:hypothetical protein
MPPQPMHIQASDKGHSGIIKRRFDKIIFSLFQLGVLGSVIFSNETAFAQTNRPAAPAFRPELIYKPRGNFEDNVARPLRYWPVGTAILSSPTARNFSTARSIA